MRRSRPQKGQKLVKTLRVQLGRDKAGRENGLDLGRKNNVAAARGIIQRLDAGTVANKGELLFDIVPDGESEHTVEAFEAVDAPFPKRLEEHLGIGLGRKNVALGL